MPRLSVTITDEQYSLLEDLSGDDGPYTSKSEAVRNLLQAGERLPEVKQERDNLRNQLAARNARQDDMTDLVEYVEDEQRYRQAGLIQRAKWFFRGMD